MSTFEPFPKIPRLFRDIIITEKIDGTNASIIVDEDGSVQAASRKRLIYPGKTTDNYGFAAWVKEREGALRDVLGEGRHFGEWWGLGIGRGYGQDRKRFSLFNVSRWTDCAFLSQFDLEVVPVLYDGAFTPYAVSSATLNLAIDGSAAAPGFTNPEGVVVYHTAARSMFKVTIENDEKPKGEA